MPRLRDNVDPAFVGKAEKQGRATRSGTGAQRRANGSESGGLRPLQLACEDGDIARVRELIAQGADPHATDFQGCTALMRACKSNSTECARELIALGVAVDQPGEGTSRWMTALREAATFGSADCLALLIEHGADVNSADPSDGQTALMDSCCFGYTDCVQVLVDNGADIHYFTECGSSAAFTTILGDDAECLRVLLDAGLDGNSRHEEDDETLLDVCNGQGRLKCAALLKERGYKSKVKASKRSRA